MLNPPSRLVIVGATGRTGLRVIDAALARGVPVAALVRDPERLGERRSQVEVIVGDVRDPDALRGALRPSDAVISALGSSAGDAANDVVARGTEHVVAAMQAVGASRFLGVVGAGVLLSESGVPRHSLPDYPPMFRRIGAQHQAALTACERSSLSWVIVGCPRILDGGATGRLTAVRDLLPSGLGQVTTGDLAALLVDEALSPTVARTRVGVNQRG
jgi:putative NADH-flavin reductase